VQSTPAQQNKTASIFIVTNIELKISYCTGLIFKTCPPHPHPHPQRAIPNPHPHITRPDGTGPASRPKPAYAILTMTMLWLARPRLHVRSFPLPLHALRAYGAPILRSSPRPPDAPVLHPPPPLSSRRVGAGAAAERRWCGRQCDSPHLLRIGNHRPPYKSLASARLGARSSHEMLVVTYSLCHSSTLAFVVLSCQVTFLSYWADRIFALPCPWELSLTLLLRLTPPASRTSPPCWVRAKPQSPFPPDPIIHVALFCGKTLCFIKPPFGLVLQPMPPRFAACLGQPQPPPNRPVETSHNDHLTLISHAFAPKRAIRPTSSLFQPEPNPGKITFTHLMRKSVFGRSRLVVITPTSLCNPYDTAQFYNL